MAAVDSVTCTARADMGARLGAGGTISLRGSARRAAGAGGVWRRIRASGSIVARQTGHNTTPSGASRRGNEMVKNLRPDHSGKTLARADNADGEAPVVLKPAADIGGQRREEGRAAEEAKHPAIDEVELKRAGGVAGENAAEADHAGADHRGDSHAASVETPAHEDAANAGTGILQGIGDRGHGAGPVKFGGDGFECDDNEIDAARPDQHEHQGSDEHDGPSACGGIGNEAWHCLSDCWRDSMTGELHRCA